ncbi:tRNA glutamyl-Q(34) synthetase GluQRS [Piscinibacter sakaiensis]|uniref:tRNA glutamyl-Q(34) synthetase GluQRS n=1 Tax=Piscinibacter sakaiensis TaxID=1547922 RepID=UPI003AAE156F
MPYRGRFAPSPTGPLHAGSMVAALASWLDARAHRGAWLVRIEDVDAPRCVAGADELILRQLAACGLLPDEAPVWQSRRSGLYQAALDQLVANRLAYRCVCSRSLIAAYWDARGIARARHAELPYPGTCRDRHDIDPAERCAVRVRCATTASPLLIDWTDRRLGPQQQELGSTVGDFVVLRNDGLWAYQLAVVVDDADQGITDIVRGEDLADNTARQIHLQQLLGLARPGYLHTPLVLADDGQKLSKQTGAQPIDADRPLDVLRRAGEALGLRHHADGLTDWLAEAVTHWSMIYPPTAPRGAPG